MYYWREWIAVDVPFDLGKNLLLQRQILRDRLDHVTRRRAPLGELGTWTRGG